MHSRTTRYNGPAIIHSISDATFHARTPISLGPADLNVAVATTSASTDLQTAGIQITQPRLRGRIATRRIAASHDEAQAIASQHTTSNTSIDLDKRIDQSVARIRKVFQLTVLGLELDQDED